MPICQCGCGQPIPEQPHHKYKPPRFLYGHHRQTQEQKDRRRKYAVPDEVKARSGLCECGCGQRTEISDHTRPQFDQYRGYPQRFAHGHHRRGKRSGFWKGGRKRRNGYWALYLPDHHLADANGYVLEHRLVYAEYHGITLPKTLHVHHIDENIENNDPENLIAMTRSQHARLHFQPSIQSERMTKRYQDPEQRRLTSEATKKGWETRRRNKGSI